MNVPSRWGFTDATSNAGAADWAKPPIDANRRAIAARITVRSYLMIRPARPKRRKQISGRSNGQRPAVPATAARASISQNGTSWEFRGFEGDLSTELGSRTPSFHPDFDAMPGR